jgi:hypothetical protein
VCSDVQSPLGRADLKAFAPGGRELSVWLRVRDVAC